MNVFRPLLLLGSAALLAACAATPEQRAERAAAQQRYEQNLQAALAAQCSPETAALMRRQFEAAAQGGKMDEALRLQYVDKVNDPVFQACYKMAWQNHIAQMQLREAHRREQFYDDWGWRRPLFAPFWW